MTSGIKSKLKKTKKRRILIVSAGGSTQGNIQCLYIQVIGSNWEIISHLSTPYTQKISSLFEKIRGESSEKITLSDIPILDYRLSFFCIESIKTALSQLQTIYKKPHYIIFNKLSLWRGPTGENLQQNSWDLSIGDPQLIASTLGIPVFTDFVRHNILAGGQGLLPLNPGNNSIVSQTKGRIALVNIGVLTRMTVIDTTVSQVLHDSDVGPGTHLLNKVANILDNTESFDRDGTFASQGTVDGSCLDILASEPWFLKPGPKQASPEQFNEIHEFKCVQELSPLNRMSTLTALTARLIYNFYRKEVVSTGKITVVYVSGGGVYNLTLMEFLSTYFSPVPVKSIEELGIPADVRLPLALGLTVDAHITGVAIPWESGNMPKIESIGKWVTP